MSVAEHAEVEELEVPLTPRVSIPKPPPAKPGDLIGEKRTMARRLGLKPPTAQKLREHAEKFGIDGVAEAGAEAGMGEESLTALIISLDRINSTFRRDPRKKHLYQAPAKKAADRRARELLGIPEPTES